MRAKYLMLRNHAARFGGETSCRSRTYIGGVTKLDVVSDDTILFWKDNWKIEVFQDKFPRAFSFAKELDISVRQLLSSDRLGEVFHLPLSMEALNEVAGLQAETLNTSLADGKDV